MSELEKAYVAGFFDGEGSVCISRGVLSVSIAQVDKEILECVKSHYGGSITLRRLSLKNPKWQDAYQWNTKTRKARTFLEEILPYLRLKKRRANLAIEHQTRASDVFGSKERSEKWSMVAKTNGFGKWMTGRKLPAQTIERMRASQQQRRAAEIHPVTSITVL